jgi:hypothetical protein
MFDIFIQNKYFATTLQMPSYEKAVTQKQGGVSADLAVFRNTVYEYRKAVMYTVLSDCVSDEYGEGYAYAVQDEEGKTVCRFFAGDWTQVEPNPFSAGAERSLISLEGLKAQHGNNLEFKKFYNKMMEVVL